MTREEAIILAKLAALDTEPRPIYVPASSDLTCKEWVEWMPHEWVIEAILTAATREPLTKDSIEFGLHCNLEDCSEDEARGFYCGVQFAEYCHGVTEKSPPPVQGTEGA